MTQRYTAVCVTKFGTTESICCTGGEHVEVALYSDHLSVVQQLEQQAQKLREALRFYAERDIYPLPIMEIKHFEIFRDGGNKARAALKETETA